MIVSLKAPPKLREGSPFSSYNFQWEKLTDDQEILEWLSDNEQRIVFLQSAFSVRSGCLCDGKNFYGVKTHTDVFSCGSRYWLVQMYPNMPKYAQPVYFHRGMDDDPNYETNAAVFYWLPERDLLNVLPESS